MKKVIIFGEEEKKEYKPVELTHFLDTGQGWVESSDKPRCFDKIVYMGNDELIGDIFIVYDGGLIHTFRGHLNSGQYE